MNKNVSIAIVVIVLILGFWFFGNKKEAVAPLNTDGEIILDESTPTVPEATGIEKSMVDVYTLAEVATHNSASDCWSAVNGNVYDLTSWVSQHPGGEQAILGICGKDGSEAFNGQHGGSAPQENKLESFKIGTLQ